MILIWDINHHCGEDSMDEDDSMIDSDDGWAGTCEGGYGKLRKRNADGGEGMIGHLSVGVLSLKNPLYESR